MLGRFIYFEEETGYCTDFDISRLEEGVSYSHG
jgi:hypothetical protein